LLVSVQHVRQEDEQDTGVREHEWVGKAFKGFDHGRGWALQPEGL
jgi:hypothetical protein